MLYSIVFVCNVALSVYAFGYFLSLPFRDNAATTLEMEQWPLVVKKETRWEAKSGRPAHHGRYLQMICRKQSGHTGGALSCRSLMRGVNRKKTDAQKSLPEAPLGTGACCWHPVATTPLPASL